MPRIVSIVGHSGAGKTTLIEKIVPELRKRGYTIGVVKHAHHGFDMDKPGKDSWRHQKAGADTVIVTSPDSFAMIKKKRGIGLEEILTYFHDVDLVIAEGYKKEKLPKIEIFRSEAYDNPICLDRDELVGFVSDRMLDLDVPAFGLEEIEKIADFIQQKFLQTAH
jgi:molybdopterin-guanine dinucleotide biosynthesis adapter protein